MSDFTATQKDKLLSELRMVVSDAEQLLDATAGQVGEGVAETRGRIKARLHQARENLHQLQETAVARAKEAGQATDVYVHDNPWKSVGVAAGIGLLVGILIGRR
jgi:ElaB/YqjD/DUF883 family membrane-anchored ribosome-binding protein